MPNYTIDKLHKHFETNIDELLPSQSNNSGKYLTTNGETISWATVDALPSQSGNAGKYLYTDGSNSSWEDLPDFLLRSGGTLTGNIYGRPVVGSSSTATGDDLPVLFVSKDNTLNKGGTLDKARYFTLGAATDATGSLTNDHKFGQVQVSITTAGKVSTELIAYRNTANNATQAKIAISQDKNGNVSTEAPTPATDDNSTQIATTAFVKAQCYITSSGSITGNAATATKLGTSDVGSATQPIYLAEGVPTATTYTLGKSVPSNAIFTDTTYTNGTGLDLTDTTFSLKTASSSVLGGIKVGNNLSIDSNGVLSATYTTYTAGNNITITGTTISAEDQLPTQTGNSGKFLTTDGSSVSWGDVDALPSQTGNSGKYLTTNGTTASWTELGSTLPTQTGNAGKVLITNGTTASWESISYTNLTDKPDLTLKANVADLAAVATSGSYNDLSDTPTIPTVPTNVSSFTNDSGYITSVAWDDITNKPYTFTPAAHNHDGVYATPSDVSTAVANLVNSAPATLDTLDELANALGDDPNFATTVATEIGEKLDSDSANYVKSLSISGQTITVTKGDNSTSTLTTQDTTYTLPAATTSTLGGVIIGSGLSVSSGTISVDDQLPNQTGNSGKYLTTNGTSASWVNVDALPAQANNAGKFLTTDGTDASWADLTDIVKISSLHYPNTNDTTITLTTEQSIPSSVNKYTMSVYRNGIYLNNTIDYGFNSSTRVLTFNKAFGVDEIVTVVFNYFSTDSQTTFDLDIDQFEAGNNITFTDNPVTNKIIISSTDSFSNWDKDYDDLINKPVTVSSFTNDAGYITGVAWDDITNKPSTFAPATHNHDTEYAPIDIIPDQTNNSGKYLTTDGTDLSWSTVDALPTQTNNSGKFLTTNGTTASWSEISSNIPPLERGILVSDGETLEWNIFSNQRFDYVPNAETTTVNIPLATLNNSVAIEVYRNGMLLTDLEDYSINTTTGVLTLVSALGTTERISVISKVSAFESDYTLPIATSSTLGGVKIGSNLTIDPVTGVLSADDQLPTQTGNSGKVLTTNGVSASWQDVDGLPDQTNNSGKILSTDGTDAEWKDLFSRYTTITVNTEGTNTVTIPSAFLEDEDYDAMAVYLDGIKQVKNIDYTYNSNTGVLTFVEELLTGDTVVVGIYSSTSHYEDIDNALTPITNPGIGVLVGDGTSLEYKTFTKMVYTVDTTADNEIITIPSANITNAVVTEVFRNGLLMVPSDDYTINTTTGVISFVEGIKANEKIVVLTQNAVISNVEYTNTAITQDITDNSTNVATTAYVNNKINSLNHATVSDVTTAINNRFANPIEKVNVIASNSSITIDPNSGSLFMLSLSTNASITIGSIQNGPYTTNGATITMYLNNTSNTISWDSTKITWMSGEAPDVTSNPSIITFVTFNGGSTWYGSAIEISS